MNKQYKKIIRDISWIENVPFDTNWDLEYVITPEYPSDFRSFFGPIPVYFTGVHKKCLLFNAAKKFLKNLTDLGFVQLELGRSSFKYVHPSLKILIQGDVVQPEDLEEDEDGEIQLSDNSVFINFYPHIDNKGVIERVFNLLDKYLTDIVLDENNFFMIAQNQKGLYSHETRFKAIPIKDNRYDLFYGKDFPYEKIMEFIAGETNNLMLFHGVPGSGKTNLLKHIITNSKRKVIYISPSMVSVVASPDFINYMMDNRNSILIIEDAEEILGIERNSATNNLLQMADGFLRDSFKMKVIATFNCDIGKIDPALLRKGRLHLSHKFDKLTTQEANALAMFCEVPHTFTEATSLADIFNWDSHNSDLLKEPTPMGFGNF
jgi:hypothetical protein